jgi:hypothetical protein
MFKEILFISGKPGLFKMISQSKNMMIVESLIDGKRYPSFQNEKISLLNDIAMFAEIGEKPLREILKNAWELEKGEKIAVDAKFSPEVLREYFAKVFPDFNREKIYPTDIRKFIVWYNLLVDNKITDFDYLKDDGQTEASKDEKSKVAEKKQPVAVKSVQKTGKANSAGNRQTTRVANKKGS